MSTELWLRDPTTYALDALVNGFTKFVFTWKYLQRAKIDPLSYMRKWCVGTSADIEFMVVGPQGAQHFKGLTPHNNPIAVYPVWTPDMPIEDLEGMMMFPVAEEEASVFEHVPPLLRPRKGQQHRVIIGKLPMANSAIAKDIVAQINHLAIRYEECSLHIHAMQQFNMLFSNEFRSVDFDPVGPATGQPAWLYLPNGMLLVGNARPEWPAYEEWINLLGFQLRQITDDRRMLTAFNMKSVSWAAEYFTQPLTLKMRYRPTLDEAGIPRVSFTPATRGQRKRALTASRRATLYKEKDKNTDFVLCDFCIYRATCKLVRVNSVCVYKGAETVPLADAFGSRDADRIITGLSDLLKMQADRTERAIEQEAIEEDSDSEVTKQINALFRNGVLLAKLLNPALNGKGVTINNNVNTANVAAVSAADPRQLVAGAIRALEAQGFDRAEITPDMLKAMLQNPGQKVTVNTPVRSIEGVIVPSELKEIP